MKMKRLFKLSAVLVAAFVLCCGGPEEKKMVFFTKGKSLYAKGEYVKARLEFKNAIQIDPKFADGHFMLGMVEVKTGNPKKAFGMFKKAVDLDPGHVKANIELGKLYLVQKVFNKAMERATFVLEKAPGNIDGLMLKASVLYAQKKYDSCETILKEMLDGDPANGPAFLLYGGLKMAQGKKKEAEEIFTKGIKAIPENLPLRFAMAEFYTKEKRNNDAEAVYRELVTLKPKNMGYRIILTQFYSKIGEHDKAESTLKEIIKAEPLNPNYRILMARFLMSQKRAGEAETVLKEAVMQEKEGTAALFSLGDFYIQWRKPELALATYQKIVDKDIKAPDALRAKNQMAKIHFSLKNYTQAEELLNSILKDNPGDLQAHSLMGELAMVRGDGPRAVSEFRTLIGANPDFALGYLKLAQAHLLTNDTNLAKDNLQKCLNLKPDFIQARRSLAKIYEREGSYIQAESELMGILEKHPKNIATLADLGDLAARKGEIVEAEDYYTKIITHYPKNPLGHYKLGILKARQKKYGQALTAFEKARSIAPDRRDLFTAQIQTLIRMDKVDTAVALCEKQLSESPNDVFVHNILGEIYLKNKAYAKALKAFNKAIDLAPNSFIPYRNLAGTYMVQGKTEEAIKQLEERLRENPENVRPAFLIGVLSENNNDTHTAISHYRMVIEKEPNFIPAVNNLAFLIADKGGSKKELKEALQLALKAVHHSPNDLNVNDTLGWVYFRMGEYEKANGPFQKLLDEEADNPVFNYHLGMLFYKQGRGAEARELLKKALAKPSRYVDMEKIREVLKELG